ncbi:hypothetical protein D7030_01420 [Flavobacteriaceae bacterium AU392]|nr:hypothetical protein D1817_07875 [Flavobacteriaceae bacterium]RKM86539.1 hypothetical protein D7030_01420 [Flavobacteriaceae bacterium AU392]
MCVISKTVIRIKRLLKYKRLSNQQFKLYLDYDLVFYDINFDGLSINFVYNESELYDNTIEGVPACIKLQRPDKKSYEFYPDIIDNSKLQRGQKFAILEFKYIGWYSTKSVTTVQRMRLTDIRIEKT